MQLKYILEMSEHGLGLRAGKFLKVETSLRQGCVIVVSIAMQYIDG